MLRPIYLRPPLTLEEAGHAFLERVRARRAAVEKPYGISLPPLLVCDDLRLPNGDFVFRLYDWEVCRVSVPSDSLLAVVPVERRGLVPPGAPGVPAHVAGLSGARWVSQAQRQEALDAGWRVLASEEIVLACMESLYEVMAVYATEQKTQPGTVAALRVLAFTLHTLACPPDDTTP